MDRVRIIGVGQRLAGDDGVGLAVLDALRELRLPEGVELREASDPTALIELLADCDRAIVIDAVVSGGEVGTVLVLDPSELALRGWLRSSSHGLAVAEAIELARALGTTPRIELVAVEIPRPASLQTGLSPEVSRAVAAGVETIRALFSKGR